MDLSMNMYWSISITIPGELVVERNQANQAPKNRNSSVAGQRQKIEIEDITEWVFGLGDNEPEL
jgi:hypothetical protein